MTQQVFTSKSINMSIGVFYNEYLQNDAPFNFRQNAASINLLKVIIEAPK